MSTVAEMPAMTQDEPLAETPVITTEEPLAETPAMTTEALFALPEDGVDRELIRGQLRERPMTKRNRQHSRIEASVAHLLKEWLELQPGPRGQVVSGEAGFRIRRDPDTTVGIDAAYVSPEVAAETPDSPSWFEGPPVLAVEILSPSDEHGEVVEKIREYLDAGVPLVWIIDPDFRTVVVYRPDAEPELFNVLQEIAAEPHLPGFQVPTARIFA